MPTTSFKTSPDLDSAIRERAKLLGYRSVGAYLKGLIRYDMMVQGPHTLTIPWAELPLDQQDQIDAKVLRLTKCGVGERGQLLKRIVVESNGTPAAKAVAAAGKSAGGK